MNHKSMISASMMCADLVHLKEDIRLFESEKIDYLHIDVMDGSFVPNYGLGVDYIRGLRELTNIPLDLHLMVDRPEEKYTWFSILPEERVSIHYESTPHIQRALEKVKSCGCTVMLAINPGTPIYSIEEVLDYIDGVTLLTVNPGFAGQKMVQSTIKKMEKLRKYLDEEGYSKLQVEVDGNITFEHGRMLRERGADLFVAGTSSIFRKEKETTMLENIQALKKAIAWQRP